MTTRLVLSREDPLQTDFLTNNNVLYTSETINYSQPLYGSKSMTTVTRRDCTGGTWQVGVIEWPANPDERPQVIIGTRSVEMTKTGLYTAPEMFQAQDGRKYEWQINNYRAQLVPLQQSRSAAHVATFLKSSTGSIIRKKCASLVIPPEASHILDDIVVTFIYFESQWRNRERFRARCWDHPVA